MSNPNDYNFSITPPTDSSENYLRFENSDDIQFIHAQFDCDHFGVFGKCYPQTQETVQKLCESKASKFYSDISQAHELGQQCVDIILFALNAIPNVKAWQTPPNSVADVIWKWDVIIEFQNNFYPLQIKSGLDSIRECEDLLDHNITVKTDELQDKIDNIEYQYEEKIEKIMEKYGYETHKNATIFEIKEQQVKKIQLLQKKLYIYQHIAPLFIWSSRNKKALKDINRIFSNLFAPTTNPEELIQAAWISYQNNYKTAKELLLTEQQEKYNLAKSLKAGLEKFYQTSQQYLENKRTTNLQEQKHINLGVRVEEILLNNLLYKTFQSSSHYEDYCKFYLVKIEEYENSQDLLESLNLIAEDPKQKIIQTIKSQPKSYQSQKSSNSLDKIFNIPPQFVNLYYEVQQKIDQIDKFNHDLHLFKSEEIELMTNCITQLLELKHYF